MFVHQVMFDLANSAVDRDQLRGYLRAESVDAFAAAGPLPSRASELIGHGPTVTEFDVEATVEGVFTSARLNNAGRAYE